MVFFRKDLFKKDDVRTCKAMMEENSSANGTKQSWIVMVMVRNRFAGQDPGQPTVVTVEVMMMPVSEQFPISFVPWENCLQFGLIFFGLGLAEFSSNSLVGQRQQSIVQKANSYQTEHLENCLRLYFPAGFVEDYLVTRRFKTSRLKGLLWKYMMSCCQRPAWTTRT